jgi:hypothetical protein
MGMEGGSTCLKIVSVYLPGKTTKSHKNQPRQAVRSDIQTQYLLNTSPDITATPSITSRDATVSLRTNIK